jgi:hypothetical protein
MCDGGVRESELWDEHFGTMCRYYRGILRYRHLKSTRREKKTQVYILHGRPGSGKSGYAHKLYPKAYTKDPVSKWWDGYDCHNNVIVDDYEGAWPYEYVKNLCDRYPFIIETKGGTASFIADTIIFTSNLHPRDWYPTKDWREIERRCELIARKDRPDDAWIIERDTRGDASIFNPHTTIPGLQGEPRDPEEEEIPPTNTGDGIGDGGGGNDIGEFVNDIDLEDFNMIAFNEENI